MPPRARPPITGLVRLTFLLAGVVGGLGIVQIIGSVLERSYLDANTPRLIAESQHPDETAHAIEALREPVTLSILAGVLCLAGALLALWLRVGRGWARLAMMGAFVAATVVILVIMSVGNVEVLSDHMWAGPADPPGSLMLRSWYPPTFWASSLIALVSSIAAAVLLFREPLKDYVDAHLPEAGAGWDLSATKKRQDGRTQ